MKKMHMRFLLTMLLIAVLAFSLTACDNNNNPDDGITTPETGDPGNTDSPDNPTPDNPDNQTPDIGNADGTPNGTVIDPTDPTGNTPGAPATPATSTPTPKPSPWAPTFVIPEGWYEKPSSDYLVQYADSGSATATLSREPLGDLTIEGEAAKWVELFSVENATVEDHPVTTIDGLAAKGHIITRDTGAMTVKINILFFADSQYMYTINCMGIQEDYSVNKSIFDAFIAAIKIAE